MSLSKLRKISTFNTDDGRRIEEHRFLKEVEAFGEGVESQKEEVLYFGAGLISGPMGIDTIEFQIPGAKTVVEACDLFGKFFGPAKDAKMREYMELASRLGKSKANNLVTATESDLKAINNSQIIT